MTKEEIIKKIYELKTEDEIRQFIKQRIEELEAKSEEKVVGQNYTDSFTDYISSKIHYKPAERFDDAECPDLVYDDVEPYVNLIKAATKRDWCNELSLFTSIFGEVYNYLPLKDIIGRYVTYSSHKGQKVSIKEISNEGIANCSEKAGLAHNMFKLLGVASELVVGARDSEMHAYLLVYPQGYGTFPVALYDPSHFVSFKKVGSDIPLGYFKLLSKEEYELLKSGEPFKIDLTSTEYTYRKYVLGDNGPEYEYSFYGDEPYYTYGLEAAKKAINQGEAPAGPGKK